MTDDEQLALLQQRRAERERHEFREWTRWREQARDARRQRSIDRVPHGAVVAMLADGRTTADIAAKLHRGVDIVEDYMRLHNLKAKS